MPRYTIDTDDEASFLPGDASLSFASAEEARAEAHKVLCAMAKDLMPDGNHRVFKAVVRDDGGREVYTSTLTLEGGWHIIPTEVEDVDNSA